MRGSKKLSNKEYYLKILNKEIKSKCIPTGYHTQQLPSYNKCDYCYSNFENNYDQDAIILEKENLNELLNEVEESHVTGDEDEEVEEI
ncbi:8469_t:CDS:2 [Entrophospora sp. SA101]|nr:8469_t:CDS:2 [Entrophospora sp. SA101]